MASESAVADGQAMGSGLSQVERVLDTFVAPSKTFTDILRSTSWWLPFLLAVVVSVGMAFTIDKQVGFDRVVENQIQASQKQQDQLSGLTPESPPSMGRPDSPTAGKAQRGETAAASADKCRPAN